MRLEMTLLTMIDSMELMDDVDDNVVTDDDLIEISAHSHLYGNRATTSYSPTNDPRSVD